MKSTVINHPFFSNGALMFEVRGEMVFLSDDGNSADGNFSLWFTGSPVREDLNAFLDECQRYEHDTEGTGLCGSFAEMLAELKADFERTAAAHEPSLLERLNNFSDRQLDEIYYRTIGYCPIAEDNESRETVIEVLAGWEEESGEAPTIPDNIESFR